MKRKIQNLRSKLKANSPSDQRSSRKTFRNAQMEIMGLVIIVILLSLALLFVLQFIILRPASDLKESFTQKEIASNTVNTLLDTTTDCRQLPLSKLLEDCAEGAFIQCPTGNSCSHYFHLCIAKCFPR